MATALLDIGGGNGTPIFKFDAKDGRWYKGTGKSAEEIHNPVFVCDLRNIVTGWVSYPEGQSPKLLIDPDRNTRAPNPQKPWKRCFVVKVFIDDEVREFMSASLLVGKAIRELHAEYEAAEPNHPGEVPQVACKGTELVRGNFGNNHKPILRVIGWFPRPDELLDELPVDSSVVYRPARDRDPAHIPTSPPATPVILDDEVPF